MQDTTANEDRTNDLGTWLPENSEAVVVGATGGIGAALTTRLVRHPAISTVHALSRSGRCEVNDGKVRPAAVDITDEASIQQAAAAINAPRIVLIASGILHDADHRPEKSWRELDLGWLEKTMRINAFGPALVAKHLLPKLPRQGKSVFAAISARVGSIEDNRLGGWYGYRASKAALNMFIRSCSIELARTHPEACILGLHPGTVDTALSHPFQRGVPAHKLFTADFSAGCLLSVIDGADADDSGRVFAWDGQAIPF